MPAPLRRLRAFRRCRWARPWSSRSTAGRWPSSGTRSGGTTRIHRRTACWPLGCLTWWTSTAAASGNGAGVSRLPQGRVGAASDVQEERPDDHEHVLRHAVGDDNHGGALPLPDLPLTSWLSPDRHLGALRSRVRPRSPIGPVLDSRVVDAAPKQRFCWLECSRLPRARGPAHRVPIVGLRECESG